MIAAGLAVLAHAAVGLAAFVGGALLVAVVTVLASRGARHKPRADGFGDL